MPNQDMFQSTAQRIVLRGIEEQLNLKEVYNKLFDMIKEQDDPNRKKSTKEIAEMIGYVVAEHMKDIEKAGASGVGFTERDLHKRCA